MKVFLTGGAGYIGSHTAVELLMAGHDIIVADNYSNSSASVVDCIKRITNKAFKFYEMDICDSGKLDIIFKENPDIDVVIHFAGYKSVGESTADPIKYYSNNLESTLSLLKVMIKNKVYNIVFSSSATVYGVNSHSPCRETDVTGECSNPYGWSKFMIEQVILDLTKANENFSAVILRYFNPVGAHESGLIGERPSGVPNNLMPFISQVAAQKIKTLNVFGHDYNTPDGTGIRDYVHVVDLAKGHLAAVEYAKKNCGYEVFNLGTGKGYSVLEVIEEFSKVNGVKIPYELSERRKGDLDIVYADVLKAKQKLGWQATRNLTEMCIDTWNWENQ